MTPIEFKKQWAIDNHSLNPISLDRLTGLGLQQETIAFLSTAGLPDSAAPYLSFAKDTKDLHDGINRLNKQYDFLENGHEKYIVIGSDGSGNPIAVDTGDKDKIVWLDHEDNFACRYMNNSIETLAETLLAYRSFISQILSENGEDAFLDSNFTDIQFEKLKQRISAGDNNALMEGGFWKDEMQTLLANRQDFSSKS